MSDFLDSKASEFSEDELHKKPVDGRINDSNSSEDSEEEEELPNEDEICRKEGQGWIVNDDEEEEGTGESDEESNASEKSAKDDGVEDDDYALDDEDYKLIQENVGIDMQKKAKKRRLILDDDDDPDIEIKKSSKVVRGREAIAREIFESDEERGDLVDIDNMRAPVSFAAKSEDEGEESDDMGDFIVDDAAGGLQAARQKRQVVHKDPSLQQAQDIFGVDFDFEEFEQYGEVDSDISEESDYEDEEDEDGRPRRKGKRAPKVPSQDRVYELFDPTEIARNFYSTEDEQIRCTDVPERFQLRTVPVRRIDPQSSKYESDLAEIEKESEWIYNVAFKDGASKKTPVVADKIFQVLKLMKETLSEVPFIAFYRKECIKKDLNINDLWRIYDYDEKWEILQQRRKCLIRQLDRQRSYFDAQTDEEAETENRLKSSGLINLIALTKNAASLEEVHDVRLTYLLHYAVYTESMLIWEGKDLKLDRKNGDDDETSRKKTHAGGADGEDEDDEDYDPSYDLKGLSVEPGTGDRDDAAATKKTAKPQATPSRGGGGITTTIDPLTGRRIRQRQVRTTAAYEVAQRAGIEELVKLFGLTTEQFADNVRDQYRRHEVTQCPKMPLDAAQAFVCPQFADPAAALRAARYMLAFQIAREPVVRQLARMNLSSQAVISLTPTSKGMQLIDESHPLYPVKFLKGKPASDLMTDVLYLHIHNAVRDKFITMKMFVPDCQQRGLSLLDDLQHSFHQDEFSALVEAWNEQRSLLLKEAIEEFLQPHIFKEIQEKLLEASQQAVMKLCAQKLFKCIKVAPYILDDRGSGGVADGGGAGSDAEDGASRHTLHHSGGRVPNHHNQHTVWPKPARVLAFALKDDTQMINSMVAAVYLDADGEVVDFLHLPALMCSLRSQREDLKKQKEEDMRRLSRMLTRHRPQAIVVGCDSRRSLHLRDDIQRLVDDLSTESRLSTRPNIELVDTELAIVYAQSMAATSSMPSTYSPLLRQAVSLGRKLQDPLAEFAQLFNPPDNEILGVRWHAAQDSVPREMLLKALEIEFINRTNEVGVDVNRCILHPHTATLLQFVSGLGPRKATYMIKLLKHKKTFLTNRELLAKVLKLGPHVAINCAGFIKIDTTSARDFASSGDNIEILDSMRVHPESYDLARQMAVDALEYDEADDNDPTAALEEIVQSPARLRELDLDAFAEELKRQDHGDKHITLYDIRKELNHRYRDLRDPFEPLTPEQIFSLTTHETPETLHVGRLVDSQVIGVATRKPRPDQLDQANPTKNEATGLWSCPFCKQNDFQQLNEMWAHFDSNECPGQAVGLRVQLENQISGFIPARLIDPPVDKVFETTQPGTILQARVMKIDITKYTVELTLKASDIQDERHLWVARRDPFFDYDADEAEQRRQEVENGKQKANSIRAYTNRIIFHPHFKNISYTQLMALEPSLEMGAIVIRPSRAGTDHLTVSLKIDDGILKHFDVVEKDKTHSFSLGRTLVIGTEEFEDLDEIVARYMQPMVYLIRDVFSYKYYRDSRGGNRDILGEALRKEKEMSHAKIPYFLSSCSQYPGSFLLAYLPNQTPRFEYFSVKPDGFKFRQRVFPALDRMIGWFKEHYNESATLGTSSHYRGISSGHHLATQQSPAPHGVLGQSTRTPKMEEFFNLPIPYVGGA